MHPELLQMVAMLGRLEPRELILVSNGSGLIKDTTVRINSMFEDGLTSICLDEYDGCDFVKRIKASYKGPHPIYSFTGEDGEKFRGKPGEKRIVVKEDVSHLTTPYDKVNTHCGGGGPLPPGGNPAIAKRCAKPFRELTIRWDGNVAICCNDFRGVYKIGNLDDFDTLEELWNCEAFYAARQMLYHNSRDFNPCSWCDAISPRVGLLPDKKGKQTLPVPDAATMRAIGQAIAGMPYTLPVLRGWETGSAGACLPEHVDLVPLQVQPIDRP
jgi:radical SAM protein with 4Fe4S-binding SPASM domain